MKVERIFNVLLVLALLLSVGVQLSQAQVRGPEAKAELQANAPAATVASRISYQGVLKESGSPVTGTRDMNFKFYTTTDCSGVALQTVAKAGVQVTNGVFSTTLDVTATNFDGQALYVQVEIGGTNISCQEILPVPYALGLRPGARIGGTGAANGSLGLYDSNGNRTIYLSGGTGELLLGATGAGGSDGDLYIYNSTGGTALDVNGATGRLRLLTDAGDTTAISVGHRYRDNAIVAWAKVTSAGTLSTNEFGVTSVTHPATGRYDITLNASAAVPATLIPIAIAEIESPPTNAATLRIVSVNQTAENTFSVYINNGTGAGVDNDFVFMVTAR
jgi:hypothetical protein